MVHSFFRKANMKRYIYGFLIIVIAMIIGFICAYRPDEAKAGLLFNLFKTVEYNGHTYILHTNSEHFIHNPDCKCLKKGE